MENDKSLKRSASDLLLYKSISGGVLAIPASSKPKNMVFYQRKETDTDYIFNTWAKLGGSSSYENVCKTHQPQEDLKVCLTKA